MAQGLHLAQRMALQQVLAPQLQQSLALLQAPTLELRALVEQELEQNPVLEELAIQDMDTEETQTKTDPDADSENPTTSATDLAEPPSDLNYDPATEKQTEGPVDDFQVEFDKLVQMDQEWKDHFAQTNVPTRQTQDDEEKRQYMFDSLTATTSLQEVLIEQVRTSSIPEELHTVAEMIVGNIDDTGYLKSTVDELAFSTNTPVETINQALKIIHTFHPPGVGARDLRECLMLQLERKGEQEKMEYIIVRDHMDALGRRRFPEIARALGVETDEVQDAVENIGRLEPKPGRDFAAENQQYVSPEVFVDKVGEEWVVTLNSDQVPHLRISNVYKDMMALSGSNQETRDYIREKIRAGKFFIKSLHQRQQTIMNIANEIVLRQKEFLEKGVSHLRPMTMVQVAEVVKVHETTVSRAVSGKYIETPHGLFEMKYFFTSGVKTTSGEGMSNTSVKEILGELVASENNQKPLSDDQLVIKLKEKGIEIARRTVAKYRGELNILPSHLRKQY